MEIPDHDPHYEGPIFDSSEDIDRLIDGVETHKLIASNALDGAEVQLHIDLTTGESFSLWLATEFPELFSGENTLDAYSAFELLHTLRTQNPNT